LEAESEVVDVDDVGRRSWIDAASWCFGP